MADVNQTQNDASELDLNEVIKIRRDKLQELISNGKNPFEEVRFDKDASSKKISENYADYEGKQVKLAGRLISKRIMGKASFAHLLDGTETFSYTLNRTF
jgi:Lysyl-tRNA synthetase (class II)